MKKRRLLVITVIIFSLLLLSSCNLVGEAKRVATDLDQTAQSAAEEPALRTQTPTEEHYIYGAGREARYKNGELIYTHQDYLGSSRATTDSSGEKEEDNTYLPYGESLGASS